MSFSSEVKKELGMIQADLCCQKAELYGIIRYKAQLVIQRNHFGIQISTTLNVVARRIISLFRNIYNIKSELLAYKRMNLDYKVKYVLSFNEGEKEFLKDLGILNSDNTIREDFNRNIIKCDECKKSLMRGLFMCQGSVNDPKSKGYHLEMIIDNEEDIPYLIKYLEEYSMTPKVVKRSKGNVIYLKKAEQIGDFLGLIGAVSSLFKFEDARIEKDYSNNYNRVLNCDISNDQRVLMTAQRQLDEIRYIVSIKGDKEFTPRLLDAIKLRIQYPDYSLSELSEVAYDVIGKRITKSGLGHCFSDIHDMYINLKGKK